MDPRGRHTKATGKSLSTFLRGQIHRGGPQREWPGREGAFQLAAASFLKRTVKSDSCMFIVHGSEGGEERKGEKGSGVRRKEGDVRRRGVRTG